MSLALFSAGQFQYVYEVLDKVLLPCIPWAKTGFYFDAIYTKEDIDEKGIKRIDDLIRWHEAEAALLVDDLPLQCWSAVNLFGQYAFKVPPFDSSVPGSERDTALLDALDHEFFYLAM